jgi:hypothetical protein
MLEKMRLEEQLLRLTSEVQVLKAENDQLRASNLPQAQSAPTKLPSTPGSTKKGVKKERSGELERHMNSFRRKLQKFVRDCDKG